MAALISMDIELRVGKCVCEVRESRLGSENTDAVSEVWEQQSRRVCWSAAIEEAKAERYVR